MKSIFFLNLVILCDYIGGVFMNRVQQKSMQLLKKVATREISNTTKNRCLFLCYQPKLPKNLKKEVK